MKWEHPLSSDRPPMFDNRMLTCGPDQLVQLLGQIITDERRQRIESVLDGRSYDLCFILDHLVNPGNVNAIIRTCESFGHAWLHIIEDQGHKRINRNTAGAHYWMEPIRWPETIHCMDELKRLDYRFLAATLSPRAKPLQETDFSGKVAIILGNEDIGCSSEVLQRCDGEFYIPSVGMTKSFNVSVAAAMIAQHAFLERMQHGIHVGNLSPEHRLCSRARAYLHSGEYRTTLAMLEHAGFLAEREKRAADNKLD